MTVADPSVVHFGAQSLLHELHALLKEVEGVRLAEDLEHLHRMRVASRRLRQRLMLFSAILPEKRAEVWLKEVRRLTRALGLARDRDVQIELLQKLSAAADNPRLKPGYDRLLLRLRQRRATLQKKVIHALNRAENGGEFTDMERHFRQLRVAGEMHPESARPSAELFGLAKDATTAGLEQLLSFEIYIGQLDRSDELHEMRIAAKRLRYTFEAFAPLYPDELKREIKALKGVQEHLGDVHDCDVWIGMLPGFMVDEKERAIDYLGHARGIGRLRAGIDDLTANRRAFRDRSLKELVKLWAEIKEQKLWPRLVTTMAKAQAKAAEVEAAPIGEPPA